MKDVLETLDVHSFDKALPNEIKQKAIHALEQGKVIYFPKLSFLLNADELQFLSPHIVAPSSKNISYDIHQDKMGGSSCQGTDAQKLKEMIRRFALQSRSFIDQLFPSYTSHLNQARTSFRPVEIAGRVSSYRKDDTLLHVDSFPATPVKGRRILRFFTNVNPHGHPRVWKLGEPFANVVQKFGKKLKKPLPGLSWLLKTLRITKDYRSLYDHYMMHLHDQMKADQNYQQTVTQYEISFPSGSSWAVFTDQASHAALSGQHVLEQTWYLPVTALNNPETSPLHTLERFYGSKLT